MYPYNLDVNPLRIVSFKAFEKYRVILCALKSVKSTTCKCI